MLRSCGPTTWIDPSCGSTRAAFGLSLWKHNPYCFRIVDPQGLHLGFHIVYIYFCSQKEFARLAAGSMISHESFSGAETQRSNGSRLVHVRLCWRSHAWRTTWIDLLCPCALHTFWPWAMLEPHMPLRAHCIDQKEYIHRAIECFVYSVVWAVNLLRREVFVILNSGNLLL